MSNRSKMTEPLVFIARHIVINKPRLNDVIALICLATLFESI